MVLFMVCTMARGVIHVLHGCFPLNTPLFGIPVVFPLSYSMGITRVYPGIRLHVSRHNWPYWVCHKDPWLLPSTTPQRNDNAWRDPWGV